MVFKIIGIVFAALLLFIALLLVLNVKFLFDFSTEGNLNFKIKLLCFTVYDINKPKKEKKNKKPSKIGNYFKKLLGLDGLDSAKELKDGSGKNGISETASNLIALFTLFASQAAWLVKRIKLKKFRLIAICADGDAADAAMEYGLACSVVYPFVGYLESNFKNAEKALDIQLGCDFEGDAFLESDVRFNIRVIHILRAAVNSLSEAAEITQAQRSEENI
ncbi:MAG: hypothetical protein E7595_07560 [Ruminococcaceae bacterium]|nr:hypothetical protein [Oscillospiraceae bacterium]